MNTHTLLVGAVSMILLCGCSSKVQTATGPNKALFDYLGDPVPPPANLDAAYTKQGLSHGVQSAAQAAGISLVKLEVDDSEFPFLVGLVCASAEDRQKLEDQISKVPGYNYTGGWGGNAMRVMNLVPLTACPAEARQRIVHRMALREEILGSKIGGAQ
jgi:hypothetical protein